MRYLNASNQCDKMGDFVSIIMTKFLMKDVKVGNYILWYSPVEDRLKYKILYMALVFES
jgi:hypothetical protein